MAEPVFRWIVDPSVAYPELCRKYAQVVFQSGSRVAAQRARDMEAWAKANAPWTDRTGAARATLHASVEESGFAIGQIVLAHGVDYGVWLEIAHGGQYAIIAPAIDMWGPIFMQDIQRIVNLGLAAR